MNQPRHKYFIVVILVLLIRKIENTEEKEKIASDCPFSKIIEDIFKIHNKTFEKGIFLEDSVKAKEFLTKLTNITSTNVTGLQNDEISQIIESINRIKRNMTEHNDATRREQMIEAIIFDYTKNNNSLINPFYNNKNNKTDTENNNVKNKNVFQKNTERPTFVEILTIEPNNTNKHNASAHNIIEILKHLMPMFNSTLTKEIHNFTIIEKDHSKNHTFSAVKNISTIVVTYCDNENLTKIELPNEEVKDTDIKYPDKMSSEIDDSDFLVVDDDETDDVKLSVEEERDINAAADYGVQKMHELYTVMEPKLYSLGLWMDDSNPARYVAAFNAPSEDTARLSRYGYASLQAAAKLRQLTSIYGEDGLEGRTEDAPFPGVNALRQSSLLQHCPLKGAPKCPPASKRYRTHDGTCNNFNRPRWGSTMTPVQRFLPPSYSDGIQAPRRSVLGPKLPSAREISSTVHEAQNTETPSITHLLMQWGQFLDHDITATSQTRGFNGSVPRCCRDAGRDFVPKELMHPECMPIAVPSSDPFYGPRGVRCLDFIRSSPAPREDCALGWREQMNQVTAYIDASPLYGSSAQKSDKLRLFRNGMLQYGRVQQRRPLLPPEKKDELCRGGALSVDCFKSGDARVNEHPGLVAAHIVWLRQHNRMAQELAHLNPHWSDEKIYQETRKIVGAMIQHITYKEFLPIVLGSEVMKLFELTPLKKGFYKNYDPKVNPSPASSFGSAAFRFGHSLVQPSMMRYDRFHRPMTNNVTLHNELSNPSNIWSMGAVDRLLLGMVNQPIQKRDEFITEELTNHLFQTPKFDFGMDLAAINIQRGRDHGVPGYNSWREPCGLSPIKEFGDLFKVMPARAVRKIQTQYRHIDDVDLFTGGMAERPVVGGLVGPTFACIIAQQFSNLRKGDRFWYENGGFDSSFTPAQLQQIRRISLAQVLCRTLDSIDNIQPFAFLSSQNPGNERLSCSNGQLNNFDLSPWTEIDTNDIGKFEDRIDKIATSTMVSMTKRTTTRPTKTKITPQKLSPTVEAIRNTTKSPTTKGTPNLTRNITDLMTDKIKTYSNNKTVKIDDKLDFGKNKTRRFDNTDSDDDGDKFNHDDFNTKQRYDFDEDDDDTQSVQSVQINNFPKQRPGSYNRPVISVTENIDKFTYLINYVPRPTQNWRKTTRKPYKDRDVVKITYQNYDETYKRPQNPYYDRRDDQPIEFNYRRDEPNKYTTKKYDTHKPDKPNDHLTLTDKTATPTTETYQKLVTFGYVGTYKGTEMTRLEQMRHKITDKIADAKDDFPHNALSKDFSIDDNTKLNIDKTRLSTFFRLDTSTKPYASSQRPTRKHEEDFASDKTSTDKYYFMKHPDLRLTLTDKPIHVYDEIRADDILEENYNSPGRQDETDIQDRSDNTMTLLASVDIPKSAKPTKLGSKIKMPAAQKGAAKTPSVAFEVIPSENSPSLWMVYEERSDIPEDDTLSMPPIPQTDPYALREVPRPLSLPRRKSKRKPGSH